MAKSHLVFVLSDHSLNVVEMIDQSVNEIGSIVFEGKKDFQYKEQIQAFLTEKGLVNKEYDDYSLSWFSPLSTLVPMNVFGSSSAKSIFQACFTKEMISNDVDYNRISELSLVNVFEIPLWAKSFFVIRYPRIVMQHEGSVFLRGIFSNSTFKTSVHIVLHQQQCLILMIKQGNLLFYNTFESLHEEDVLYYLSFSLQQQELLKEDLQLFMYDSVDTPSNRKENILNQIKHLKDLHKVSVIETKNLPFKYQQTCV
jgi:hypothetical protein